MLKANMCIVSTNMFLDVCSSHVLHLRESTRLEALEIYFDSGRLLQIT